MLSEPRFTDRTPAAASVLLAIVEREQPTVLLTQRTIHLSTHSGQIAFPGGRQDPHDQNLIATALREAQEEVGLMPEYVDVLGTLPIYQTGSAFIVTPVVGILRGGFSSMPYHDGIAERFIWGATAGMLRNFYRYLVAR